MARLKSKLQIEGTLGELSFYKTQDGIIVRQKWGPDKKRMKNDPAFETVKNHGKEFGTCAKNSSLLRRGLRNFILPVADNRLTSRVNKLMLEILRLDTRSKKGERLVQIGLENTKASGLIFEGLDFNIHVSLKKVFTQQVVIDVKKGTFLFKGGITKQDLRSPKGATGFELAGAFLRMDFENKRFDISETNAVLLSTKGLKQDVQLTLSRKPKGPGIFVLRLIFYKGSAEQKELMAKENNVCGVVGVL